MAIHHSTKTRAEKMGIILTEITDDTVNPFPGVGMTIGSVQAFWPKHNMYTFGFGDKPAQSAVEEMIALQTIKERLVDAVVINDTEDPSLVRVYLNTSREQVLDRDGTTPRDALLLIEQDKVWQSTTVPLDGAQAHHEGFPITDNPHDEENDADDFAAWDEAWENAADKADAEGQEEEPSGSVVRPEFRIRYAELGHPAHCGDELAVVLNNLVLGKSETDLEKFEAICAENGVDTTKYKREGTGWQGRIRMTGRNLLARKVYAAGGVLNIPEIARTAPDVHSIQLSADWMSKQRFKLPKPAVATEAKE